MSKKNESIDILKAFGIIAVIIGHCISIPIWSSFIYLINLPIFFIVSGYLYKDSDSNGIDIWEFLAKKLKRFWIYYFGYNCFLVLFHNVFIDLGIVDPIYKTYYLNDYVFGILNSCLFVSNELFSSAMWFIPVMMVSLVLFHAINYVVIKYGKTKKEILRFILVILSMLFGIFLCKRNINVGLHYQTCFVVIPFIYVGYLYKRVKENNIKIYQNILITVSVLIATILSLRYFPGKVDMSQNNLWYPILFYPLAIGLTYVFYLISKLITKIPIKKIKKVLVNTLSYIGAHTMPIMCLHFFFIKLVDLFYIKLITREYELLPLFPFSYSYLLPVYIIVSIAFSLLFEYLILKIGKGIKVLK